MAAASPPTKTALPYPIDVVLHEHAKYVVFIKELQSQVQTLQDFRSRVLQAFPHLDISLYCNMAMAKLSSKRSMNSNNGFMEQGDMLGQLRVKQTKPSLQKKNSSLYSHPRKVTERNTNNSLRTKPKRHRKHCREKKCTELNSSDYQELKVEENNSAETSASNYSFPLEVNNKVKCDKMKLDGTCCVAHRQDSGFSTDGKDKLVSNHPEEFETRQPSNSKADKEDELMNILDIIEQRSVTMRTRIENSSKDDGVQLNDPCKTDDLLFEVDRLQFEKEILIERLLNIEIDQKLCKEEINRLKDSLYKSDVSKRVLEERLEAAVAEREQLGTRINRIHSKFISKNSQISDSALVIRNDSAKCFTGSTDSFIATPDRIEKPGLSKLKVHIDKAKVSAILQESRTLELQRQLLISIFKNEVVRCRVENQEREWNQRVAKWQQIETQMHKDIEALKKINNEIQTKIHKLSTELRMERTKRKVLERALHAAYKDLTNATSSSRNKDGFTHSIMNTGSCKTPKIPSECDALSPDYLCNSTKAHEENVTHLNSNISHGDYNNWFEREDSTNRSAYYQSNYPKTIQDFSQQDTKLITDKFNESERHSKSSQLLYVPPNNNKTLDELDSQWKWSYHIDNVPERKLIVKD